MKHGFFSRQLGREVSWNDLINSGWQAGSMVGIEAAKKNINTSSLLYSSTFSSQGSFFRLQNLMSFLMVRHTKADLIEIPTPVYSTTDVTLSPSETITVRLINIHFIINFFCFLSSCCTFLHSTTQSFQVYVPTSSQHQWKEKLLDGKTVYSILDNGSTP